MAGLGQPPPSIPQVGQCPPRRGQHVYGRGRRSPCRPVRMTALVREVSGSLPMASFNRDGAEMQRTARPTVVIGGLITSTLLTSLVIPHDLKPWFARGLQGCRS